MSNKEKLAFGPKNYKWMLIGLAVLIIGFLVMSADSQPYGFGFLGITLGPILVLSGFGIELYAILTRPAKEKQE